ncbi:hypothetical protein [Xanthomonas sp. 1678]|uniref:AbiTii domain-containing protein n=1 Tax=Xanthomonas sp. 1678 TaxID=3158788 RepID=UPI002855E6ED|nr:hypothetical protein [Xanthomonas translucens]
MQLVDEIIDLLSSADPSVENALFKAQVLAHRMGEADLALWVESELKGYAKDAELPSYRIVPITILGNASNGAYRVSEQPLPVMHLDPVIREKLDKKRLNQSISVIEGWCKEDKDLSIVIAPEFYPLLNKGLGNGYQVERAWGKPSMGAMLQVVTEVRSRLLEFALKLSDRLPAEARREDMKQLAQEAHVGDLFRNSVFGDNTTIVVGSGSIQNVTNSVVKNDMESLVRVLREHQVAEPDIQALQVAIKEDATGGDASEKSLGPKVRAWIGSMVAKAGSAGWKVSISAAGGLLAKAIGAYYGIGA